MENGWWNKIENQRHYMDVKRKKLGYSVDDLVHLTCNQMYEDHGSTLFKKYKKCIFQLVCALYPEKNWIIWEFDTVSNGTLQDKKNIRNYMLYLCEKMGFTKPEHWYNISRKDFKKYNGESIVTVHTIKGLLKILYPNFMIFLKCPQNYYKNMFFVLRFYS